MDTWKIGEIGRIVEKSAQIKREEIQLKDLESINELQSELRSFARERDWEQFHTPKNVAMALVVESAELLEMFQWLTPDESQNLPDEKLQHAAEEIADIQIYLARLADLLDIDVLAACSSKLEHNRDKYPSHKVRGSAKKYTEYDDE